MKSVIQSEKECFVCKTTLNLHCHHIYGGNPNRRISEKYGLKVYLCQQHHTGDRGVHFNKDLDLKLKVMAQEYYEAHYGNRNEFINAFGRSYI